MIFNFIDGCGHIWACTWVFGGMVTPRLVLSFSWWSFSNIPTLETSSPVPLKNQMDKDLKNVFIHGMPQDKNKEQTRDPATVWMNPTKVNGLRKPNSKGSDWRLPWIVKGGQGQDIHELVSDLGTGSTDKSIWLALLMIVIYNIYHTHYLLYSLYMKLQLR